MSHDSPFKGTTAAKHQHRRMDFSQFDLDEWTANMQAEREKDRAQLREDRSNALAIGRWVRIEGLQAKPELNGLTGEVIDKEPSRGRVGVLVHLRGGATKECALKPQNLCTFRDEETVMAVRLGATREGSTRHVVETRVPRHLLSGESPCPVPRLAGIPLMMARTRPYVTLRDQRDYDNQWATYLMIEPNSGFAPLEWQSLVGPVLVYRDDNGAFNSDDMLMLNEYLTWQLDNYADGPGTVTPQDLTPQAFQKFKTRQVRLQEANADHMDQTPDLTI